MLFHLFLLFRTLYEIVQIQRKFFNPPFCLMQLLFFPFDNLRRSMSCKIRIRELCRQTGYRLFFFFEFFCKACSQLTAVYLVPVIIKASKPAPTVPMEFAGLAAEVSIKAISASPANSLIKSIFSNAAAAGEPASI